MLKYIARRLLMLIPVLLGVILLVFSLMYITPGDPVDSLLGDNATPEAREALREELGLNGGYFERFFNYVVRLLRGDMGICYSTRQNVATRIAQTFPNTVKLASFAVAFAVVFGLTFGIVSAIRQYSIIDNIVMSISMIGISMPSFWCGLLLMLLFCVKLKWLPASGFDSFSCVILPGIALGVNSAASIARMTRSSMLEVIRQDYISTARAKGLSEFKVVTVHALKNALIPVITTIGRYAVRPAPWRRGAYRIHIRNTRRRQNDGGCHKIQKLSRCSGRRAGDSAFILPCQFGGGYTVCICRSARAVAI